MADEENESRAVTMDLNLYLGFPRSPCPRGLDLGSDLSLSSLPLPASSDSGESLAPEATSAAMEASASHVPYSPSHAFIEEAEVPSAGHWPPAVENPLPSCFFDYEPCGHACAQEREELSTSYSLPNVRIPQTEQVVVEHAEIVGEIQASLEEILGLRLVNDNSALGDGSQTPYSPSYHPSSADFPGEENFSNFSSFPSHNGREHDNLALGDGFQTPYSPPYHPPSVDFPDEENFGTFPSFPSHSDRELYSTADGSSSQQDLLQSPEFRIQRLVESRGWRQRSLRQSLLYGSERTNYARHSSSSPEQLMLELMSSQRSLETNGKQKAPAEVVAAESSEKDSQEKKCATNFDCNICFEIAKDPVVTSCGHLFCWSCLYQWLYVHTDHKECPVCKGEVTEANITPIYGRGSSQSDTENKYEDNSASGLSIPPRPCGNRLESWRQHFYPISRRIGEGIANSWRRFLNYQMRSRTRFRGHEDALMQEIFSVGPHSIHPRTTTRRLHREHGITESGPSIMERRFQRDGGTVSIQNDIDTGNVLHCFPGNDRLASISSEIGLSVGIFAENSNPYGASSSVNAATTDQLVSMPIIGARPAATQASASSTVAVIRGESSMRDASTEPNSAGSSRPYRRIGGSSASGSSDDGGNLRARKRRRLH